MVFSDSKLNGEDAPWPCEHGAVECKEPMSCECLCDGCCEAQDAAIEEDEDDSEN